MPTAHPAREGWLLALIAIAAVVALLFLGGVIQTVLSTVGAAL